MKAGTSPKIRDPLLKRGFKIYGRLDMGIGYSIEDLSYMEAKILDLINTTKNKIQGKEMQKAKRKANAR